jgi:mono/diheme cytochrome c family protein
MRHVQVARLSAILVVAFSAAAILFAATRPGEEADAVTADANDGASAYEAHCADCHGREDILSWEEVEPDEEARRAWLDRLLERHYPPPEELRPLIIDHIERVIAEE